MSNCLYEMIEQPTLLVATSCHFVRMNPFGKVIGSYFDPVAGERNRRQKESFLWLQESANCTVEATTLSEKTELRVRVLLAVQQSLLGSVSPNLRAVTCSWSSSDIQVRAIFDLAVSEIDKENMGEVETEIMSRFPDQEVAVSCTRVDAPAIIGADQNEVFVFKRREG
ncbi:MULTISPECIES: hypothetical protein [unclassified Rhizobium]|uniref:hypothetical protein n=1 Tax=unclassified Rhizobium TaxID=2613769 RepID=UPI0011798EFD|nr:MULTISPECIES: hypothetical protein [unclassified Rhizobium]MDF0662866.1 hypothetical protein [Rhizobium sp. BC49]